MDCSSTMAPLGRPVLRVSAPGKVILFGEHSVVYERLAVAAAVGLRTSLQLYQTRGWVSLDLPDIGLRRAWTVTDVRLWFQPLVQNDWRRPQSPGRQLRQQLLEQVNRHIPDLSAQHAIALVSFFYLYGSLCPSFPGIHVEVSSELPTGAGLGSSAAYGVALVTALLYCYHQEAPVQAAWRLPQLRRGAAVRPDAATQAVISGWALASDDIIHGSASGIDNAICTQGGAIAFRAGKIRPLESAQLMQVLLVDTRVSRDTRSMVQRVRERCEDPLLGASVECVLDAMDLTAAAACSALTGGDETAITRLVQVNQGLLHALGVSHPTLDSICLTASRHGLMAKLTGAGGGGFALIPVPFNTPSLKIDKLKEELTKMGYGVSNVDIGGPGVTVQNLECAT